MALRRVDDVVNNTCSRTNPRMPQTRALSLPPTFYVPARPAIHILTHSHAPALTTRQSCRNPRAGCQRHGRHLPHLLAGSVGQGPPFHPGVTFVHSTFAQACTCPMRTHADGNIPPPPARGRWLLAQGALSGALSHQIPPTTLQRRSSTPFTAEETEPREVTRLASGHS